MGAEEQTGGRGGSSRDKVTTMKMTMTQGGGHQRDAAAQATEMKPDLRWTCPEEEKQIQEREMLSRQEAWRRSTEGQSQGSERGEEVHWCD